MICMVNIHNTQINIHNTHTHTCTQTLFNIKLDLCTSACDFDGALALLDTLRSNRQLGMPKEGLPRLREAIAETQNSELLNSLDSMCADLEQ